MSEDITYPEMVELKSDNLRLAEALNAADQNALDDAENSVIRVGYGRGFVAQTVEKPVIITCAHCLPHMPPAVGGIMMTEEKTYPRLVGVLGQKPTITVECLFVDPVADVAVLGEPDGQALPGEAEAYQAFVAEREGLRIATEQNAVLPDSKGAWLTLEGKWVQHRLKVNVQCVSTTEKADSGMSGSPDHSTIQFMELLSAWSPALQFIRDWSQRCQLGSCGNSYSANHRAGLLYRRPAPSIKKAHR